MPRPGIAAIGLARMCNCEPAAGKPAHGFAARACHPRDDNGAADGSRREREYVGEAIDGSQSRARRIGGRIAVLKRPVDIGDSGSLVERQDLYAVTVAIIERVDEKLSPVGVLEQVRPKLGHDQTQPALLRVGQVLPARKIHCAPARLGDHRRLGNGKNH